MQTLGTVSFKEWKDNISDRKSLASTKQIKDPNRVGFTVYKSGHNTILPGCSNNKIPHYLFAHNLFRDFYILENSGYEKCSDEEAKKIFEKVGFLKLNKCKDEDYDFLNGFATNTKNIRKHTDILLYKVPGLEKPIEVDANDSFAINMNGQIIWCHAVVENRETKNSFNGVDVCVNLESNQHQLHFNEDGSLQNLSFYNNEENNKIFGIETKSSGKRVQYNPIKDIDNENTQRADYSNGKDEKDKDDINITSVNNFTFLVEDGKEILGEKVKNFSQELQNDNMAEIYCYRIDDDRFQLQFFNENGQMVTKFVNKKGEDIALPQELYNSFLSFLQSQGIYFDKYTAISDGKFYFVCTNLVNDVKLFGFDCDKNTEANFILKEPCYLISASYELKKECFPIQCENNKDIQRVVLKIDFIQNKKTLSFYDVRGNLVRVDENIINKEEYDKRMMQDYEEKKIFQKIKKDINKDNGRYDYNFASKEKDGTIKYNSTKIKLPKNKLNYAIKATVVSKKKKQKNITNHAFHEVKTGKTISNKTYSRYRYRGDKNKTTTIA